jgi:isopenicillin N synthase-like dioxygenase
LTKHGIPKSRVDEVFAKSAAFFALDQDSKDKLGWTTPDSNRGYVSYGREKVTNATSVEEVQALRAANPDLKESIEIGRDDIPSLPNQWPSEDLVNGFKATMKAFFATCLELQISVMRALALGLGLEETFFDKLVDAGDNNLRLLHYPPVPKDTFQKPNTVRAGEHSDYGTITLLFQDTRGGLQVRSPKGTFVNATPIEGTIVINAGDLLARWANGRIASTKHRVVEPPPPSENSLSEEEKQRGSYPARYSVAYFGNPNFDAWIEALPGTYKQEEDKKYPGIISGDYLVQRLTATYT